MFKTSKFKVVARGRLNGRYPAAGEIVIHTHQNGNLSGAILLKCPLCGSLQPHVATVSGPDDAPTVTKPMKCGCERCDGPSFIVTAGEVRISEPETIKNVDLTDQARNAGVFYPSENR